MYADPRTNIVALIGAFANIGEAIPLKRGAIPDDLIMPKMPGPPGP